MERLLAIVTIPCALFAFGCGSETDVGTEAGGAGLSASPAAGGVTGSGASNTGAVSGSGGSSTVGGSAGFTGGSNAVGGSLSAGGSVGAGGETGGDTGAGGALQTAGGSGSGGSTGGGTGSDDDTVVNCDRALLKAATAKLKEAIEAGDPSLLPVTSDVQYTLNSDKSAKLEAGKGIYSGAAPIDSQMDLIDVTACKTFSEIIAASWDHQYVVGIALTVDEATGNITEIYEVETDDEGDWAFDADNYLKEAAKQDWTEVVPGDRLTRQQLDEGARGYFEFFADKEAVVPWGDPCSRIEGGMYLPDMALADTMSTDEDARSFWGSCSVGVPPDMQLPILDSIIDVDYNMVVLIVAFGESDSHLFRFEQGINPDFGYGMRYVHTLTSGVEM